MTRRPKFVGSREGRQCSYPERVPLPCLLDHSDCRVHRIAAGHKRRFDDRTNAHGTSLLVSLEFRVREPSRPPRQLNHRSIMGGPEYDPGLAEVAARFGAGIVCSHTGGAAPRTNPFRVSYRDVVAAVNVAPVS